jgi:hypothetical protein
MKSLIFKTSLLSVTLEHLKQLFLKLIQSKNSAEVSDSVKSNAKLRDQSKIAQASKLEFKTVNEMYIFN